MSKVSLALLSVGASAALITLDNGREFLLHVAEADGPGGAQVIEDCGNGEIADYLDHMADLYDELGDEGQAFLAQEVAAKRAEADDWTQVYGVAQ